MEQLNHISKRSQCVDQCGAATNPEEENKQIGSGWIFWLFGTNVALLKCLVEPALPRSVPFGCQANAG